MPLLQEQLAARSLAVSGLDVLSDFFRWRFAEGTHSEAKKLPLSARRQINAAPSMTGYRSKNGT